METLQAKAAREWICRRSTCIFLSKNIYFCNIVFFTSKFLVDYGSFETFHGSEQLLLVYVAVTLWKCCSVRLEKDWYHTSIELQSWCCSLFWNALNLQKSRETIKYPYSYNVNVCYHVCNWPFLDWDSYKFKKKEKKRR